MPMRDTLRLASALAVVLLAGQAAGAPKTAGAREPVAAVLASAVQVATGIDHTCAVTQAGGLKCWGHALYGQLGDGTRIDRPTPVDVSGLSSGVVAVTAGYWHTCALTAQGAVKCWGQNQAGGSMGDPLPVDMEGLSEGVTAISMGYTHTCALMQGGGLKCWGLNGEGELGDGTRTVSFAPVDVIGLNGAATAVSAGFGHTCAVIANGGAKCWGDNSYGQLGYATQLWYQATPGDVTALASGVRTVAGGGAHTCALMSDETMKCWGQNNFGQLGTGTQIDSPSPVPVSGLAGVKSITAGRGHTCAMATDGGTKCWGENQMGQLGNGQNGDMVFQALPGFVSGLTAGVASIATRDQHTCATMVGGSIKCWGYNYHGGLGDGTTTHRSLPVDVIDFETVHLVFLPVLSR